MRWADGRLVLRLRRRRCGCWVSSVVLEMGNGEERPSRPLIASDRICRKRPFYPKSTAAFRLLSGLERVFVDVVSCVRCCTIVPLPLDVSPFFEDFLYFSHRLADLVCAPVFRWIAYPPSPRPPASLDAAQSSHATERVCVQGDKCLWWCPARGAVSATRCGVGLVFLEKIFSVQYIFLNEACSLGLFA